jgi:hypothetical protein
MKKIHYCTSALFVLLAYGNTLKASPASTEYVNQRVNAAVLALQNQINAIPSGKQGIPGPQGLAGPQGEQGLRGEAGPTGAVGVTGAQGLAGTYSAGDGIAIDEGVIKSTLVHHLGELYQGGIIFFVDETGTHGLIAALHDANEGQGVQWKNGETGEKVTNARANGIGAGASNTKLIIAQQTIDYQPGNFAALAAANYSVRGDGNTPCTADASYPLTCYGDWYLPSIYELDLMRLNLGSKGGFLPIPYWSSTESGVSEAWFEDIQTGTQSLSDKANQAGLVRAIRAF